MKSKSSIPDAAWYRGRPCRRCGRKIRYKTSRNCVYCVRARARQSYWYDKLTAQNAHRIQELI